MPEKLHDYVPRGRTESTPLGRTIFCGLRALDPLLQRSLLLSAPLASLASYFGRSAANPPPAGGGVITTSGLNLTPFQAVIWGMSVGSAVKQIFYLLALSNEPMYPGAAIFIALFNTINNTLNTVSFTIAAANPTYLSPYSMYIGAALYTIGILVETHSEIQRKYFKDRPENKGRLFAGGLFSLARHINYGGYALWRSGMALAAGGPVWGSLTFAFFTWNFSTRAVPVLEEYCREKYGEQYKRFEKEVPYRLFPGFY